MSNGTILIGMGVFYVIIFSLGAKLKDTIPKNEMSYIVLFLILLSLGVMGCMIFRQQNLTPDMPSTPIYPHTTSLSEPTIKDEVLGTTDYIQATYQEITVSDPRPTVYAWYRETYQRLGWDYNEMNDDDELYFSAKSECYSYKFSVTPHDTEQTQTYLLRTSINPGRSCPSLPTIQP